MVSLFGIANPEELQSDFLLPKFLSQDSRFSPLISPLLILGTWYKRRLPSIQHRTTTNWPHNPFKILFNLRG